MAARQRLQVEGDLLMTTKAVTQLLNHNLTLSHHDDAEEIEHDLSAVDPRAPAHDPFEFRKLSRRVCLIRRDQGSEATGFLVGPDLMLTAAHALMGTSGIFADPEEVTILFDQFIWNKKTRLMATGDQCKLRHIPFTRQPDVVASSIRIDAKSRRRLEDNGMDYVLVRLDRPIGLSFLPFSYRMRGWTNCSIAEKPRLVPCSSYSTRWAGCSNSPEASFAPTTPYLICRFTFDIKRTLSSVRRVHQSPIRIEWCLECMWANGSMTTARPLTSSASACRTFTRI
jgi:hypothetical protein